MTIVGKILVFIVLVASLLVGGLVMMVHLTNTNWEIAYKQSQSQLQAVTADRQQTLAEVESIKADYEKKLLAKDKEKETLVAEKKNAEDERDQLKNRVATLNDGERKKAIDNKPVISASEIRSTQIENLEAQVRQVHQDLELQIAKTNSERREKLQALVQARSFQRRAEALEEEVKFMAKEALKGRAGVTGAVVSRKRGEDNPPTDNIEGRVLAVDPEDNLVRLSIGSDAGLAEGHTLKVFRLDNIPEKSRFLGTIELLKVNPNEAVGKPLKPMPAMQPGDRVASRLLVGG